MFSVFNDFNTRTKVVPYRITDISCCHDPSLNPYCHNVDLFKETYANLYGVDQLYHEVRDNVNYNPDTLYTSSNICFKRTEHTQSRNGRLHQTPKQNTYYLCPLCDPFENASMAPDHKKRIRNGVEEVVDRRKPQFYDTLHSQYEHHMADVHGVLKGGRIVRQPFVGFTITKTSNGEVKYNLRTICPYANKTQDAHSTPCLADLNYNFGGKQKIPYKAYLRHVHLHHHNSTSKVEYTTYKQSVVDSKGHSYQNIFFPLSMSKYFTSLQILREECEDSNLNPILVSTDSAQSSRVESYVAAPGVQSQTPSVPVSANTKPVIRRKRSNEALLDQQDSRNTRRRIAHVEDVPASIAPDFGEIYFDNIGFNDFNFSDFNNYSQLGGVEYSNADYDMTSEQHNIFNTDFQFSSQLVTDFSPDLSLIQQQSDAQYENFNSQLNLGTGAVSHEVLDFSVQQPELDSPAQISQPAQPTPEKPEQTIGDEFILLNAFIHNMLKERPVLKKLPEIQKLTEQLNTQNPVQGESFDDQQVLEDFLAIKSTLKSSHSEQMLNTEELNSLKEFDFRPDVTKNPEDEAASYSEFISTETIDETPLSANAGNSLTQLPVDPSNTGSDAEEIDSLFDDEDDVLAREIEAELKLIEIAEQDLRRQENDGKEKEEKEEMEEKEKKEEKERLGTESMDEQEPAQVFSNVEENKRSEEDKDDDIFEGIDVDSEIDELLLEMERDEFNI